MMNVGNPDRAFDFSDSYAGIGLARLIYYQLHDRRAPKAFVEITTGQFAEVRRRIAYCRLRLRRLR